jgi:hypothetical protein
VNRVFVGLEAGAGDCCLDAFQFVAFIFQKWNLLGALAVRILSAVYRVQGLEQWRWQGVNALYIVNFSTELG